MKTTIFEVAKHLLDPHALAVVKQRIVVSYLVGDDVPGFVFIGVPGDSQVDGTVFPLGQIDLLKVSPFAGSDVDILGLDPSAVR
jgi:hypothetical protein